MASQGDSRVVLRRDTKHLLKPGVVLRFADGSAYRVESVFCGSDRFRSASSVSVTVACSDGRRIYCTPSSLFYGGEICEI